MDGACLFSFCDQNVLEGARGLGLRIPADVSVVGFDDIDLAALVDPALTTVHQPIRQKGVDAVRLLLAELDARPGHRAEHVRLETRLIVRGSTGPAPTAVPDHLGP